MNDEELGVANTAYATKNSGTDGQTASRQNQGKTQQNAGSTYSINKLNPNARVSVTNNQATPTEQTEEAPKEQPEKPKEEAPEKQPESITSNGGTTFDFKKNKGLTIY